MTEPQYIWIVRWDEFQTYHLKRGKRWVPPWIRTYPRQLDDERYYNLTDAQKLLIHELRLVFASASCWVPYDTRWLCRRLGRKVQKRTVEALNDAGLIVICSRTVLERFQDVFWNGSTPEVEVEVEQSFLPAVAREQNGRPDGEGDIDFGEPSNLQRKLADEIAKRTKEATQ